MYRHMIWDFDGTLFDTYEVMGKALQLTFQKNGIDEPLEEIIRLMKISGIVAYKHYEEKYQVDEKLIREYETIRRDMEPELCKPYPGVLELLRYGKETGRCHYLFTHRGESSVAFLKRYEIYDCFTECITSRNKFERKPSPAGILFLMDKYQIRPEEAIMIGDRELEIILTRTGAGNPGCRKRFPTRFAAPYFIFYQQTTKTESSQDDARSVRKPPGP